jgi:hypothetical protein
MSKSVSKNSALFVTKETENKLYTQGITVYAVYGRYIFRASHARKPKKIEGEKPVWISFLKDQKAEKKALLTTGPALHLHTVACLTIHHPACIIGKAASSVQFRLLRIEFPSC